MEVKDLYAFVLMLVLVGMVLGVGILVLDRFLLTVDQVTVANENFTTPAVNSSTTLANTNLVSLSSIVNQTGDTWTLTTGYTVSLVAGTITNIDNGTCQEGNQCNATYVYSRTTGAPAVALGEARDAVGDIPELWLPLIVTIAVLSLILVLVIRSFGRAR